MCRNLFYFCNKKTQNSVYNLHFVLCNFQALRYTYGIVKYVF